MTRQRFAAMLAGLVMTCVLWSATTSALMTMQSCAAFRHVARTALDVGVDLCELWGSKQAPEARMGLSTHEFCQIAENVKPFVDQALQAQRMGAKVGTCHQ